MKRFLLLLLTAALLVLTGCTPAEPSGEPEPPSSSASSSGEPSGEEQDGTEDGTGQAQPPDQSQTEDEKEPLPQPEPEKEPDPEPEPLNDRGDPTPRQAYAKALLKLLKDHVFPDGRPDGFDGSIYSMEDNKFAVCDVDGDGREELILEFMSTDVASHRGLVMDYDPETDQIRVQLDEYPAPAFFDNGAVLVHWSHNQGKGGAFWPYSLYVYRPEQDSYSFVGSVDAWDKNIDTENYPVEVDTSRSGFVYYISSSGAYDETLAPVDSADYQAWLDPYIGSADIMQVDFVNLTEENIRQITDDVTQETGN